MIVAAVLVSILLTDSYTLKDRRSVVNSLKTRLRDKFNISVAELDGGKKVNLCDIGIAAVGNDNRMVEEMVSKAVNFIEEDLRVQVLAVTRIV